MADTPSDYVNLRVSHELYALFSMQDRINKFLWTSDAAYAYVLAKLQDQDPDIDAQVALGVEAAAWQRATSGRRHFEGSLGVFLAALRDNSSHIYGTVFVQYYAAFERYLLRRSGAYRRRGTDDAIWSPLISGCQHLSRGVSFPIPLERVLLADTSRLIRNIVAHGDEVPAYPDDIRIARWMSRVEAVLRTTQWEGDYPSLIRSAAGQTFGRVSRVASKFKLPALYFYMLFSFTNLSAMALAVEEALFDPVSEKSYTIRRQLKYVRRTELVVEPPPETATS